MLRSIVAIVVAVALVAALPGIARAQEPPPSIWVVPPPDEVDIAARLALANPTALVADRNYFAVPPKEILSERAKTWIIIGAIVGGVLIIAGVFVFAKPFKKP